MNDLKFAFRQLLTIHNFTAPAALGVMWLVAGNAFAELAVRRIEIAPRAVKSRVPETTAQGRLLAPQAISAVDVSADGRFITVGTMAFSHEANVWQFAPDGTVLGQRQFPPWAPMQVATLKEELAEADSPDGQFARLRPGSGDWRTGWFSSHLGELFVHGPDWVFKPPGWLLDGEGRRHRLRIEQQNLLPTSRAMRMAASADGKRIAFGWLGLARNIPGLPAHTDAVSLWQVNPNQKHWSAPPTVGLPPPLPDPAIEFPDMAQDFRVAAGGPPGWNALSR